MNLTARFSQKSGLAVKNHRTYPDEAAAAFRSGSLAEHAMILPLRIGILLDETYEMIVNWLEAMPRILEIVGREPGDSRIRPRLDKRFDGTVMDVWRMHLRRAVRLHAPSPYVAVDATYTNGLRRANTTVTALTTAFRPSTRRNSSVQTHKRFLTFTA